MILKLNPLPLIPFVDGVPEKDTVQNRIKWIRDGDVLNGAKTKVSNEGNLNITGVQIQQNAVQVNTNTLVHNDKINEVIDQVNLISENLEAIADESVIGTLNKAVADISVLKLDNSRNQLNISANTEQIKLTHDEIGEYDPLTDPKHRTIRKDIIFLKGELGSYAGFNENGDVDPTSTGTGLKYKVMQNALGVSIHEGRITKLEDDWAQSEVGQLTQTVTDLRNEMGLKQMATFESVYVRLNKSTDVQEMLSKQVTDLSSYVGMDVNPTVNLSDTVSSLVLQFTDMDTTVNSPNTGLVVRVDAINKDIGTSLTSGTIKGDISAIKRHMIDIDDMIGESSTDGLRGEVLLIQNDIGKDSTPNTIKGRLLVLENVARDLTINLNDVSATVGNTSSGLVAANIALGKSVYGDATETDPLTKDGLVLSVSKLNTQINSNETGLRKEIADLAARVRMLEENSANKANYYTKTESDDRFAPNIKPMTIVVPMADVEAVVGSKVELKVEFTGGQGPYTYQWKYNGAIVRDRTEAIFPIESVGKLNEGKYEVTVTGTNGDSVTDSCEIAVFDALSFGTELPATLSVDENTELKLSVAVAGGKTPYNYVWSKGVNVLTGNNAPDLVIAEASIADAGSYSVRVTDSKEDPSSITSSPCVVTVNNV